MRLTQIRGDYLSSTLYVPEEHVDTFRTWTSAPDRAIDKVKRFVLTTFGFIVEKLGITHPEPSLFVLMFIDAVGNLDREKCIGIRQSYQINRVTGIGSYSGPWRARAIHVDPGLLSGRDRAYTVTTDGPVDGGRHLHLKKIELSSSNLAR